MNTEIIEGNTLLGETGCLTGQITRDLKILSNDVATVKENTRTQTIAVSKSNFDLFK